MRKPIASIQHEKSDRIISIFVHSEQAIIYKRANLYRESENRSVYGYLESNTLEDVHLLNIEAK
jgi:hypothetical protein